MGQLVQGQWQQGSIVISDQKGSFQRPSSSFRHWIKKGTDFHPEPNRYHLYVSYACPWAHRTLIFRMLKGLEQVISYSVVNPLMLENGWEFTGDEAQDPLYKLNFLYEIYQKADSNYTGKATVPVLWDKKTHTIVNNESSDIIRILNSEFNEYANQTDFYPIELKDEIDKINKFIYDNINNGVYRCGFASTQAAYNTAFDALFNALNEVNERLGHQPYLIGEVITEADWRLFTTLLRFDPVYVGHFKCNRRQIKDYSNLYPYLKRLYHHPGVIETVRFDHIKTHYYQSHKFLNPLGIVPKGPEVDL